MSEFKHACAGVCSGYKAGVEDGANKQKAATEILLEALKFYSGYDYPLDGRSNTKTTLDVDSGKRARAALADYEKLIGVKE